MLMKLTAVAFAGVMMIGLAGCDQAKDAASGVADQAKAGVDSATDAAKDAADSAVPDVAKDAVGGAIEKGGEMSKDAIDKATGAEKE